MRSIFIGGCPRSGTTLLGSMLSKYSNTIVTPESHFKKNIIINLFDGSEESKIKIFEKLKRDFRFKLWGINLTSDDIASFKKSESPFEIISFIIQKYSNTQNENSIWVDHTPNNLSLVKCLLETMPDSKFIHIIRDPRAIANSILKLDWGPNSCKEAAIWWLRNIAFGFWAELNYPEKTIRIKFEDIISDNNNQLQKLLNFCSISNSIDSKKESFVVPKYTMNQHNLIGMNLADDRILSWQKSLSIDDVQIIEELVGDLMIDLGYDYYVQNIKRISNSYKFKNDLKVFIQPYINKLKNYIRKKNA